MFPVSPQVPVTTATGAETSVVATSDPVYVRVATKEGFKYENCALSLAHAALGNAILDVVG
jgi:hypothetical protein